jgi:quercetin dioxygenase-like cupin family protein
MGISRRNLALMLPALAATKTARGQAGQTIPSSFFNYPDLRVRVSGANKSRAFFDGKLHDGFNMELHETELAPGGSPHPDGHSHTHEEMILIREGTLEVSIAGKVQKLGPGSVAFVASKQHHSWKNIGTSNAVYFVVAMGSRSE